MTARRSVLACLLMLCCIGACGAEAATTVNTQTLRLTFDGQGNLESAIACFPGCSGDSVRLQQFADDGLIRIGPRAGDRWAGDETEHERGDGDAQLRTGEHEAQPFVDGQRPDRLLVAVLRAFRELRPPRRDVRELRSHEIPIRSDQEDNGKKSERGQ